MAGAAGNNPTTGRYGLKIEQQPYKPRGSMRELFKRKEPIICLDGPAGTGKSRGVLEKIHLMMEKYPGARAVFLRKTRESLSESVLFTFETHVVPPGHAILTKVSRRLRQVYKYPNGSEIIVCGLDKPQKLMSTEFDVAYINEAIECSEEDVDMVMTRLRNGAIPYQQLLMDTNPDKPTHWLKVRADRKKLVMLATRHEDNPILYDDDTHEWTERGKSYLEKLDNLSGPRYKRLRLGKWVGAEGTIYEDSWDRQRHVVPSFTIPHHWARYWTIDFGFVHPMVWQAWAQSPEGKLYCYRELYVTQTLVSDLAEEILELTGWKLSDQLIGDDTSLRLLKPIRSTAEPLPRAVICDHDAEDRATLERETGIRTVPAHKLVSPGIQAVANRLRAQDPDPSADPYLCYLDNYLVRIDPLLRDEPGPKCTLDEYDGYVWKVDVKDSKPGDKPLKKDDHGMDATRYTVAYVDKIAEMKANEVVSATMPTERVVQVQRHVERVNEQSQQWLQRVAGRVGARDYRANRHASAVSRGKIYQERRFKRD